MKILYGVITTFFVLVFTACSEQVELSEMPEVLTIGILPDEGKAVLLERYTPLFEYLSEELGVPYRLIVPADYSELLDEFASGQVDLAYFGGFTFAQAYERFNAEPLVMRDIDMRFTSYFLVAADNKAESIAEFNNGRFSFGSRLSTSGHLMPRYFLQKQGVVPEVLFSQVSYSGSHDKTAYLIRDNKVDLGVANAKIIDKMFKDGRLYPTDLRILQVTPPYTDYVWAMPATFDSAIRTKIANAFLSLSPARPEHAKILSLIDAGGFLPASINDFSVLREVISQLNLSSNKSR